jgi:transcriptional regulator with XRE-family HTH domain
MLEIDGMSFAERVKEARDRAKLTQQQLADRCGLTDGIVSAWENGKTTGIIAHNLFCVADACGVDPRWLLTGDGHSPIERESIREITEGLESLPLEQQDAVRALIKTLKR